MNCFVLHLLIILASWVQTGAVKYQPQNGDIIFHTSQSAQSIAIQRATKSPYSHMGIVYLQDGKCFVFEAVEPVKSTPFKQWTARGQNGHYVVKRLVKSKKLLTSDTLKQMRTIGEQFQGKHYDQFFEWSDDRIYCSELVWKIYQRGPKIELGKLQKMKDFDLEDPVVKQAMRERFGDTPPLDEPVISPVAIFNSKLLKTVHVEKGRKKVNPSRF